MVYKSISIYLYLFLFQTNLTFIEYKVIFIDLLIFKITFVIIIRAFYIAFNLPYAYYNNK